MPLYHGSQKIEDLYVGSTKIGELYKGSTLVYKSCKYNPDQVIFESATPGTYSLELLETGKYEVYCIAGGGSGTFRIRISGSSYYERIAGGGSGSGFIGVVHITKNTYSINIAAGGSGNYEGYGYSGGNSLIGNILTCYGGGGANTHDGNAGGGGGAIPSVNTTIYSTQLNSAGNTGENNASVLPSASGGASLYNGYGKGGDASSRYSGAGNGGYVKIIYKGR